MKIEWCVCDMDGTLLDSRSQVSAENIQAIKQLHAAGVEVVLATGRSDLFVKDVVSQLGVTRPIICCNGGMIRGIENGDIYFSRFIEPEIAGHFIAECLQKKRDILASSPILFTIPTGVSGLSTIIITIIKYAKLSAYPCEK